jgi:flagellar basal-body rod protein FlgB
MLERMMSNKIDDYFRFHATSLSLREQRQQLLASNIANADTPNFKARDIDFTSALKNAMHSNGAKSEPAPILTRTASAHLESANTVGNTVAQFRNTAQGNIDGNTVDMDVERNEFADNSIRYEASLTMINSQVRGMLAVLQG